MKGLDGVSSAWLYLCRGSQPRPGPVCVAGRGTPVFGGLCEVFDNLLGDIEREAMGSGIV